MCGMMKSVVVGLAIAGATAMAPIPEAELAHRLVPETSLLTVAETPTSMLTYSAIPRSPSVYCVISLTVQFFIVYTALSLVRTAADIWGLSYGDMPLVDILCSAATTMAFAPMLAVLLLAVRMRVTWLTQGKGDPPVWMEVCMYCTTYAILAMTLTVVVIPFFTGMVIGVNRKTGEVDPDFRPFRNIYAASCFTVLKYLIMVGLYVGVVCIIYGACTFKPPAGTWPGETIPPPAPAVACTFIMSATYFIIYSLVQFVRTWSEFTQQRFSKFEDAMLDSTKAMNFGPMLCVLFIGARMRALQMDPLNGSPQKWAQNCFFMCTYAVIAQVLISIAIPLVVGGSVKNGKVEGDMEYELPSGNPIFTIILTIIRWVIMICLYIGAACVIYSVFTIQHPKGDEHTPPISATMQCVINLTFQFFFVYIGIWIGVTVKHFTRFEWPLLMNTIENMVGTVYFCPMLSILFVCTRMRALLITNNKGAPQGWVQDGMFLATWAVLIQFLMCMVVTLATGQPAFPDCDGNPIFQPDNPILMYVALTLKWVTYIFLYGGVIAVITGVCTMTPETANGRGSIMWEPVGVNDIA